MLHLWLPLKTPLLFTEKHAAVKCLSFKSPWSRYVYSGYFGGLNILDQENSPKITQTASSLCADCRVNSARSAVHSAVRDESRVQVPWFYCRLPRDVSRKWIFGENVSSKYLTVTFRWIWQRINRVNKQSGFKREGNGQHDWHKGPYPNEKISLVSPQILINGLDLSGMFFWLASLKMSSVLVVVLTSEIIWLQSIWSFLRYSGKEANCWLRQNSAKCSRVQKQGHATAKTLDVEANGPSIMTNLISIRPPKKLFVLFADLNQRRDLYKFARKRIR